MGDMDGGLTNGFIGRNWRWRHDDGDQDPAPGSGTWSAALNTAVDVAIGTNVRLRFAMYRNDSLASFQFQFQRNVNEGTWITITTSDSYVPYFESGYVLDDEHIVEYFDSDAVVDTSGQTAWAFVENNGMICEGSDNRSGLSSWNSGGAEPPKAMCIECCIRISNGFTPGDYVQIRPKTTLQLFEDGYDSLALLNVTAQTVFPSRVPYPYQQRVQGPLLRR